jgi:hypothetical protein
MKILDSKFTIAYLTTLLLLISCDDQKNSVEIEEVSEDRIQIVLLDGDNSPLDYDSVDLYYDTAPPNSNPSNNEDIYSLVVYPNPFINLTSIELKNPEVQSFQLMIKDAHSSDSIHAYNYDILQPGNYSFNIASEDLDIPKNTLLDFVLYDEEGRSNSQLVYYGDFSEDYDTPNYYKDILRLGYEEVLVKGFIYITDTLVLADRVFTQVSQVGGLLGTFHFREAVRVVIDDDWDNSKVIDIEAGKKKYEVVFDK